MVQSVRVTLVSAGARSPLRIWGSDRGLDPSALRPGRDLVLEAHHGRAAAFEKGVLLDDWLDAPVRQAIDREADASLRRWRAARDAQLEVRGVPLPWVYEIQLLTDVFLRDVRTVLGVGHAVARLAPGHGVLERVDPQLAAYLAVMLAETGVNARLGAAAPPPSYPIAFPAPSPTGARRAISLLRQSAGAPQRIRGSVLIMPFWHLAPLWERLSRSPATRPVVDPALSPPAGARELAGLLRRGGWIGHPDVSDRVRSRRAVARAMSGAKGAPPGLDGLLDARALAFLAAVAGDSVAVGDRLRRAFQSGLRAVVVPTDVSAFARLAALAGRSAGRGSLVQVQHGFLACLPGPRGEPQSWVDGMAAERVAVWSERDVSHLAPRAPGEISLTGNPGGIGFDHAPDRRDRRALVLVQLPTTISCIIGPRATSQHLEAAFAGLAAARPGTSVIVRPHPFDRERDHYRLLAARYPELRVELDATTPIGALMGRCDVCVGSTSTATLQAAASGVRTAFLNTTGVPTEWPLGEGQPFPAAGDADELAGLVAELDRSPEVPGRKAALDALGVRGDALERVVALVEAAVG